MSFKSFTPNLWLATGRFLFSWSTPRLLPLFLSPRPPSTARSSSFWEDYYRQLITGLLSTSILPSSQSFVVLGKLVWGNMSSILGVRQVYKWLREMKDWKSGGRIGIICTRKREETLRVDEILEECLILQKTKDLNLGIIILGLELCTGWESKERGGVCM